LAFHNGIATQGLPVSRSNGKHGAPGLSDAREKAVNMNVDNRLRVCIQRIDPLAASLSAFALTVIVGLMHKLNELVCRIVCVSDKRAGKQCDAE
jgi:hypothetical protein